MPDDTSLRPGTRTAAELTPNTGAQRREQTAEYLGRDGKWHRMGEDRALNGQPGAIFDDSTTTADGAEGQKVPENAAKYPNERDGIATAG